MTQQEAEREFFEKLGRAFREWQLVEMQLFRVYARLVRCEEGAIAADAFHAITGFRYRLRATNAAAMTANALGTRDYSVDLVEWKRLKKRAVDLSKTRNHFAHWTVYFRVNAIAPPFGPFLGRSYYDPKHKSGEQHEVDDLVRSAESFELLADAMRIFANSLPVPLGSPPLV
jgi:hypothetical protein